MTDWNVRFRHATGVGTLPITADTQEEAEAIWAALMLSGDEWGCIISVKPDDPIAHP